MHTAIDPATGRTVELTRDGWRKAGQTAPAAAATNVFEAIELAERRHAGTVELSDAVPTVAGFDAPTDTGGSGWGTRAPADSWSPDEMRWLRKNYPQMFANHSDIADAARQNGYSAPPLVGGDFDEHGEPRSLPAVGMHQPDALRQQMIELHPRLRGETDAEYRDRLAVMEGPRLAQLRQDSRDYIRRTGVR